jgi:hypothetical protein
LEVLYPKEVVLLHSLTAGVEFLFVLIVPLTVVFAFATYGFYQQDLFLVVLVLRVFRVLLWVVLVLLWVVLVFRVFRVFRVLRVLLAWEVVINFLNLLYA